MKTKLLILPLTSAALLAWAGDELKPEPITSVSLTLSVTNRPPEESKVKPAVPDPAAVDQVAARIAQSEAITVKPLRSSAQKVVDLFNPMAPMEPAPDTRWLSRAPWGTAAVAAVRPPGPIETHHEAHFSITLVGH